MARDQPSRNSARGLRDAAWHALPLTLGGRAQAHRDPLVGAAVLRAESAGKTERTWKTLSRRSDAAPFIPASRPRRDWSRTLIPCTPNARPVRHSSRARRVGAGAWLKLVTMTAVFRARAWSARRSSIYSPISVRG